MSYGIIEYNSEGKPMCELCGEHFNRVISHVRQKHDMSEREYKLQFGFDLRKGICSRESASRSREKTLSNYDKCIAHNLLIKGEKSRYKNNGKGRTKDMVSEQTRIRLKERLDEPYMVAAMEASGRKLGLSGAGNKVRWNKDNLENNIK